MHKDDSAKKIILSGSLKGFFFEGLVEINKKSLCPVPESLIFYSSDVLDKFSLSQDFFEVSDGKVREKILGMKLLEAAHLSREEQTRVYKEVGDMSLMVCGYFSESINKKIIDTQYYAQLGKMAYGHLNNVIPSLLDIPSFYGMVATSFEPITTLMSILASTSRGQDNHHLFQRLMRNEHVSDREMLAGGILPSRTDKVS
ncbi:MAG TPA: hypothetical protein VNJ08_05265 [Bacteriovoracaceae bacterium]|nr:hypothetical protein [Bacteriovoracaceae bacterium]